MSWDGYITNMTASGNIDKAAIFSAAGDSVWAISPGFTVSPEEVKNIVTGLSKPENLYTDGAHVGKEKYVYVRHDDGYLMLKKGKEGIIAVQTKQAIIIAHHPDGVQPQTASGEVTKMGNYLKDAGY